MPNRSTKKTSSTVAAPNWFVSALLLPLSIPLLVVMDMGRWVAAPLARRRERAFIASMTGRGRVMDLGEFAAAMARGEGTAIDETVTAEGPWRIWWTAEDVGAVSPHPVAVGEWVMLAWESRWFPFFGWAAGRYMDVESGTARLVVVPAAERRRVLEIVRGGRYVTVCSFARVPLGRAAGA